MYVCRNISLVISIRPSFIELRYLMAQNVNKPMLIQNA